MDRVYFAGFPAPVPTNDEILDRVYPIPVIDYGKSPQGMIDSNMVCAQEKLVEIRIGKISVQNQTESPSAYVKSSETNSVQTPSKIQSNPEKISKISEEISGNCTKVEEVVLETYLNKNTPIEDVRVFVNEIVSQFPEFPRGMVQQIMSIPDAG